MLPTSEAAKLRSDLLDCIWEKAAHGSKKMCLFPCKAVKTETFPFATLNPAENPPCSPCRLFPFSSLSLYVCKSSDDGKGLTIFRAPIAQIHENCSRLLGKLSAKLGALGGVPGELLRSEFCRRFPQQTGEWQRWGQFGSTILGRHLGVEKDLSSYPCEKENGPF